MNVVIFGASGATGQRVVERALEAGHYVSAFVRTPGKLTISHQNLRVLEGNVADAPGVARAVHGQDAVVSTLGVGTPLKHDPAVISGVGHILDAMARANVRRIVYLSFTGVRDLRGAARYVIRPVVGYLLRHEIADHEAKERLIKASPADWTIVHAPKLTNGPATGRYRTGPAIQGQSAFPVISRADVAAFIVEQLADRSFVRTVTRVLP